MLTKSNRWIVGLCLLSVSCAHGPDGSAGNRGETLQAYLDANPQRAQTSGLIACAAGGHVGFTTDEPAPTSVFFYPVDGAENFRYFETESLDADAMDFTAYEEKKFEVVPVFNGYLRRFVTHYTTRETWCMITYETEGKIHLSGQVRLKGGTKPTEFGPQLATVTMEQGHPTFEWEDGRTPENAIYFEVISEKEGDLISGTYTTERRFRFYDTSNVTTNIRDITPPPSLRSGKEYDFTLMAVSRDNWVNLIVRKSFIAP